MSATKHHRIAKGLRWAARVIGVGGIVFYLFCLFAASTFGDTLFDNSAVVISSRVTVVIALAGCFISWWREWLAGVLLIISWLTYSGWFIYKIAMAHYYLVQLHFLSYLVIGSPLLLAGLLFLLSWRLSRKTP